MVNTLDALYQSYAAEPTAETTNALLAGVLKVSSKRIRDDDARQDAVIAVWQALPTYRPHQPFSRWVSVIVSRHLADAYRATHKARQTQAELNDVVMEPHAHTALPEMSSFSAIEREMCQLILSGHSIPEVARLITVPVRTVRAKLRRLAQVLK